MTRRGIEENPDQIRAITEMPFPRTNKEVQNLPGRLATLNGFISRSSDRFKPFFDVLKKAVNFGWTDESENAFNEIKQYLSTPSVLVSPKTGQLIGVYLAATENVVSAVLFITDLHEKHVYFISKSLTGAETRYKKIEKITLALLHASRRLKPYFQGRKIIVYSEYPLKRILERADDSSRLAIWSNFLGAYRRRREPATDQTGGESAMEVDTPEPLWTVFTDGSSNVGGDGVGCVILTPEGSRIEKATKLGFHASNNEAEYEAAIIGLNAVKQLDAKNVKLVTDSMLVVNQFLGTYRTKEERMALYLDHMRELANEFDQFSIGQRPRLENRHVDALAYLSSAVETDTTRFVVVDFQELPNISDSHLVLDLEHASGGERATTSA
ncbi:uncharacterized protein LOC113359673 [Papaver somniferum]|uniref:uncharacterized protein LOC113359673 n=1 Tax=Papaver somniferum TaxID=3469 RepID=UPI000E6FD279|nr:uncharacterized protein LOC113359673 [Papaver somniferum]